MHAPSCDQDRPLLLHYLRGHGCFPTRSWGLARESSGVDLVSEVVMSEAAQTRRFPAQIRFKVAIGCQHGAVCILCVTVVPRFTWWT
jgi:hypothetical protein